MQVGDLVKHRRDGYYGTVIEVRKSGRLPFGGVCKVFWSGGYTILHTMGQLQEIKLCK